MSPYWMRYNRSDHLLMARRSARPHETLLQGSALIVFAIAHHAIMILNMILADLYLLF